MEPRLQLVDVLSQFHADPRQAQTPRQRTNKRIDDELQHRHFRDTGWKSDERPDNRKQPRDKYRDVTASGKKSVRPIEVFPRKENVSSVSENERSSTIRTRVVGRY